jgi:hypothetical protein
MDVKEIFLGLSKKMMNDFENISSQLSHSGSKGTVREETLKQFLRDYLPKKYSVSSGFIIDTKGNSSNQCDIIIYDALNSPLILNKGEINVFPCEPVLATIEVKSCLGMKEIQDCIKKNKKVKNLIRDNGYIASVVFAYTSGYKDKSIEKISEILLKEYETTKPNEYIDLLVVLDSGGLFIYWRGSMALPEKDEDFSKGKMFMEEFNETPPLFWFFSYLLIYLEAQESYQPFYINYITHVIEDYDDLPRVRMKKLKESQGEDIN